jgi:uncharacterized protein (TIGR02246 family)
MSKDEAEIRALVASWMRATREGDVDTVLGLMTEDVVFLVPGREPMRKADFAASARAQASGHAPSFDGESEVREVQVCGEWAFLSNHLRVTMTAPDGGSRMRREGYTLTVLRKVDGRWLLARDANLLGPPQPAG